MTQRSAIVRRSFLQTVAMALLPLAACNYVPDATRVIDAGYQHADPYAVYRIENFHLFDATKLDAPAEFSGVKACSLWVGGALDSVNADSLFGRIAYEKDTVIVRGDSIEGRPAFYAEDIASWRTVGYHFSRKNGTFLGRLFASEIDSNRFAAIKRCLDTIKSHTTRPPDSFVKVIVAVLNGALTDPEFYFKNRDSLLPGLDRDHFTPRINRMVNESIFLDSLGKPAAALSAYQAAAIQWFNADLLTSTAVDFVPIDVAAKVFTIYFTAKRIHKFRFQLGARQDALTKSLADRLISFDKTGESLAGWAEGFSGGAQRAITEYSPAAFLPFPYYTGTNWNAAPFFWSDVPLIPADKIFSMVQPGRASSLFDQTASTTAIAIFVLNLHYPINGIITGSGGTTSFIGTIFVSFRYQRNPALPFVPAVITAWNTRVEVTRKDGNGKTTAARESYTLHRTGRSIDRSAP